MMQKETMDANGAARDWEKWPKKPVDPVMEQKRGGDGAEKKTSKGRSHGTIGWIALGVVAAIGIGIAVGGGGGGGDTATNPGHQ